MEKNEGKLLTAVFFFMLFGITVWSIITPQKVFSENENRYLQTKPDISVASVLDKSFMTQYEDFLGDQFFFRDRWVAAQTLFELCLGREDINQVYIGKQHYLMEKFDEENIEGDQLDGNLNRLSAFFYAMTEKNPGAGFKIMLVPSASQILKDKLPFAAAAYDQQRVIDRLIKSVGEDVIDLEDAFKESWADAGDKNLYYRTDHHWTSFGAYKAYTVWAEAMGIAPISEEQYEKETVSDEFFGTIYSKLNISVPADELELWKLPVQSDCTVKFDGEEKEYDGLYFTDHLNTKDKYAVFLDGNHALTEITVKDCSEEAEGKTILIIRDSYANSFAPFITSHYEKIILVDLRYFNAPVSDYADDIQADDILVLYQLPGFSADRNVGKLR